MSERSFCMHFLSGWYRQKGRRNEKNQDTLSLTDIVIQRKHCLLALICDGIGGLEYGEIASGFVAEELLQWFYQAVPSYILKKRTGRQIQKAGKRKIFEIHKKMKNWEETVKMGTTLSMLLVLDNQYYLFHIGDSRVYFFRKHKEICQLSTDHVYGKYLKKAVSNFEWQIPQCKKGKVRAGDTFLLCSDGFYGNLSKEQISHMGNWEGICEDSHIERNLNEMGSYVLRKGETDDISAIYIRVNRGRKSRW